MRPFCAVPPPAINKNLIVGADDHIGPIPSPGGRVPQCAHWGGRGTAKCWVWEEAWYGVPIVRLPPAFLIRHGWRRATFPPGEGIRCAALVGAVIDRPSIPSPGGRVDFSSRRRRNEKDGRGTAKSWMREEAWYGVPIVRLPPAFLIRHGYRRATFPPGEGIRCTSLVGAVIDRPSIPSPGGRVDFSSRRRRIEKDGRGTAKCWIREEV